MQAPAKKLKVLFLCTGNSCRSQMAEGLVNHFLRDRFEAFSAGTRPAGLFPRTVAVMAEIGIDISGHRSKHLNELKEMVFDVVITVCSHARDLCPVFPGKAKIIHRGFDDPPRLAQGARTEEEALAHYRRVRDEIMEFVQTLPALLTEEKNVSLEKEG